MWLRHCRFQTDYSASFLRIVSTYGPSTKQDTENRNDVEVTEMALFEKILVREPSRKDLPAHDRIELSKLRGQRQNVRSAIDSLERELEIERGVRNPFR
jgi:hypothetical protein